jgi:hypothetical protein
VSEYPVPEGHFIRVIPVNHDGVGTVQLRKRLRFGSWAVEEQSVFPAAFSTGADAVADATRKALAKYHERVARRTQIQQWDAEAGDR